MQPNDCGVSDRRIVLAGPATISAVGIFSPAGLLPSTLCNRYVVCIRSPASSGRALLLSGTNTCPACGEGAVVGTGRALRVLPAGASCAIAATAKRTTVLTATMILFGSCIAIVLLKVFLIWHDAHFESLVGAVARYVLSSGERQIGSKVVPNPRSETTTSNGVVRKEYG